MFANVFVFLVLVLMLTNGFGVSMVDTDLIGMPVFMLFVYLLVAVRSMMMYKEFEHQYVLAKVENEKQIQAQRLEISKDLHDSLGAQLTFINSILDGIKKSATKLDDVVLARINTLSDFSENSITELKNTLWVLNANEITLHDLKAKILNFIKSAAEAKEDVKFSFNLDASENPNLDSKRAVNLFRVVQEIVNNAVKYADASEIGIDLQYIDDMITVRIADNGRGFDYETEKEKSFGLKNIESRMKAMNGRVHLDTEKGKGTVYTLQTEI
jgi:signal transduction histidine kinase